MFKKYYLQKTEAKMSDKINREIDFDLGIVIFRWRKLPGAHSIYVQYLKN